MIRFSIGGRTVEPEKLEDALMAAMLKELREKIRLQVGSIRDPETGEFPTVKQAENRSLYGKRAFVRKKFYSENKAKMLGFPSYGQTSHQPAQGAGYTPQSDQSL